MLNYNMGFYTVLGMLFGLGSAHSWGGACERNMVVDYANCKDWRNSERCLPVAPGSECVESGT